MDGCRPVLADFGIACSLADPESMAKRVGSPGYTAPEMLKGEWLGIEKRPRHGSQEPFEAMFSLVFNVLSRVLGVWVEDLELESHLRPYNEKVDIFSAGVLLPLAFPRLAGAKRSASYRGKA